MVKYARYIGVTVGENTYINPSVKFPSETYLVSIGNNVALTTGVCIYTHGGARVARRVIPNFDCFGKVVIEDWAYIGSNSLIMPGVTIGEGALVAAGSVVTKSVAPRTVVGGNPAKFICSVDDFIEKNMKYNIGTKGMSDKEKEMYLTSLEESRFIKK